jgi:L-lactate dehydrogenase (cytochrome)
MGKQGGVQAITILKRQLQQVMEQVACKTIEDFPDYLLQE